MGITAAGRLALINMFLYLSQESACIVPRCGMHTFPSAAPLVEGAVSTADALRLHIHKPLAGNTAAVGQVAGVEVG